MHICNVHMNDIMAQRKYYQCDSDLLTKGLRVNSAVKIRFQMYLSPNQGLALSSLTFHSTHMSVKHILHLSALRLASAAHRQHVWIISYVVMIWNTAHTEHSGDDAITVHTASEQSFRFAA